MSIKGKSDGLSENRMDHMGHNNLRLVGAYNNFPNICYGHERAIHADNFVNPCCSEIRSGSLVMYTAETCNVGFERPASFHTRRGQEYEREVCIQGFSRHCEVRKDNAAFVGEMRS